MRPQKSRTKTRISAEELQKDRAAALQLVAASRETLARLDRYVDLLLTWQQKTNLIAPATIPELWTRHVADSLQLMQFAPADAKIWVDLGSGAGFPGLVIACALADTPGVQVHLVESNQKKAAFLREAARITAVPAVVHSERIENFMAMFDRKADIVTARALTALDELFAYSYPLLQSGALGIFPKGQDVEAELTTATKYWNFKAELVPSRTSPHGRIVLARDVAPQPSS